jgi:hypothetical protein
MLGRSGLVCCTQPLRDDALKAHLARLSEHRGAIVVGVFVELEPGWCTNEQLRQAAFAADERKRSIVLAVELQQVKSLQDRLASPSAAMERVEDGDDIKSAPCDLDHSSMPPPLRNSLHRLGHIGGPSIGWENHHEPFAG